MGSTQVNSEIKPHGLVGPLSDIKFWKKKKNIGY